MSYAQNIWIYTALLFGIIIVPGMDMFFVIANALTGGRARGLSATAGVMLGGVWHTLFGAFALGAILRLAPQALTLLLFAGAAYMAWIGWTLVRSSITVDDIGATTANSWRTAFRQGFVTCVLNPKAYMFVVAVYPQFIRAEYGAVWSQALVMGLLTALMQLAIYGGLGLAAAQSSALLLRNATATIWTGRLAGVLFLAVAAWTITRGVLT